MPDKDQPADQDSTVALINPVTKSPTVPAIKIAAKMIVICIPIRQPGVSEGWFPQICKGSTHGNGYPGCG
jgi:hypothetical protein